MKVSMSSIHLHSANRLLQQAIEQRIFPGAVLLIVVGGQTVFQQAYGMADLFSRRPMTVDVVFDLASLTKPLATVLAVMHLVQEGCMALDRPCAVYWPQFSGGGKERITVRHLLSHSSGLPAWRPYYLRLVRRPMVERRDILQQWLIDEPLAAGPGERVEYSDLGFMVLQWLVEMISGQSLDRFVASSIYRPMGIKKLFFNARCQRRVGLSFAATELCPWRGRLLVGEVHDDNAYAVGGVSGHAGLFGTAGAVGEVLCKLSRAERGASPKSLFDPKLLSSFFKRQVGSWALGFDTPDVENSSAGRFFSIESIGHLGYTGTSFWMDLRRDIAVILLSNRVHPSRYDMRIKDFRPRLHNAIMTAVLGAE